MTQKQRVNISDEEEALIAAFIDSLWMHDGLSRHTLASYRTDLRLFSRWLGANGEKLLVVDESMIQSFIAERGTQNYSARSTARLLSCLRRFYAYV